ncbi:MAG TPA: serine/threonine-protein kinase, partial [Thermoleophilia bacterium]|nr:serine/threonine-protein kinase [Thermoleophilia bacterium]
METIGKYQVQKVLGRGGMGTVYEALDPLINRKVALKTMMAGLADNKDLRERFLREAQAAGGLRHRNIVTVYDLGEDKGQPYIAMEFIEGTDLEKIIGNREPLSIEWKVDILRQVCEGLAYAHERGIVHRDVKPANIRVSPEGEVKIMDFGIAHLQSSTMTKSGLVLGTVHYMSPEQIVGQKVDHRADIFSVGAIAYELISGHKPFDGDSITAVMYKIMHDRPDPAALPHTDFSPGLESVVLKALARDMSERYRSLTDMHADLERLVREVAARLHKAAVAPGEPATAPAAPAPPKTAGPAPPAADPAPPDAARQAPARPAEAATPSGPRDDAAVRRELERARTEGQLQKAHGLVKRLLELHPGEAALEAQATEIEAAIREREIEQLCGLALSYAADGDFDLAQKIAARIGGLDASNPRYLHLKSYLDDESARRTAEALTGSARDHLALGHLLEARAAAEEALAAFPEHAAAREIRDRVDAVFAARERNRKPPPVAAPPQPASAAPEPARASAAPNLVSPAPQVASAKPTPPAPEPAPVMAAAEPAVRAAEIEEKPPPPPEPGPVEVAAEPAPRAPQLEAKPEPPVRSAKPVEPAPATPEPAGAEVSAEPAVTAKPVEVAAPAPSAPPPSAAKAEPAPPAQPAPTTAARTTAPSH